VNSSKILVFFWGGGWSGTESTITKAITGLLYQPRMMMSVEQLVEYLHQCRFIHHKSHMTLPELEPGPSKWEVGD
jgi:hypothetical protein